MSVRFDIVPAYRPLLTSAAMADLDSWLAFTGGQSRSTHRDRRTVELQLPGPSGGAPVRLFAKLQYAVPKWPRFVSFVSGRGVPPSAAVNEWEWLARLAWLGIDAMEPVAVGERRVLGVPRQACLIVRAVPPPRSLHRLMRDEPALADDASLWQTLGELVGRLAGAGVHWPDLSAKHVFPQRDGDAWRLFLIDVERMTPTAGRGGELVGELESLLLELPALPSAESIVAMVDAMAESGSSMPADAWAEHLARQAERRPAVPPVSWLLGDGPRLVRTDSLIVNARLRGALADAGLRDLAGVMAYQSGQSLHKPGLAVHRTRDRIELPAADGPLAFYLKRYRPDPMRRLRRALTRGLRPSEAADEWHALMRLAGAGIPVPEPVLFGQNGKRSANRSCIGLAELPDADALERWCPARGADLSARRRRELIEQLADLIRHFHAGGTVHRDLYLSHIFIREQGERAWFYLIDLARVFRPIRSRRRRWTIKDLSQLLYSTRQYAPFVTRTDCVRFLRRYLGDGKLDAMDKRLARDVMRKADGIAKRAARKAASQEESRRDDRS